MTFDITRRAAVIGSLALSLFAFQACYADSGPPSNPDIGSNVGQGGSSSGGSRGKPQGASTGEAGSMPASGGAQGGDGAGGGEMGGAAGNPGVEDGGAGAGAAPSDGGDPGAAGDGGVIAFACSDAVAEPLPARQAITEPGEPGEPGEPVQTITLTKASLYRQFEQQTCGLSGCHGGDGDPLAQSPNAFRMTVDTFDKRPNLGTQALERILSSDPAKVMPPGFGDGSKRSEDDPVRQLGERLLAWEKAGFPPVLELTVEGEPIDEELPEDPYALTPELGSKLTNLGNCVPKGATELSMVRNEVLEKDELFAAVKTSDELPETLVQTDLVSLDSVALARRRVFSYAPTYTLFSDHAGKMRHLRVPYGETITYDAATRDFKIPDNTRFYKTFLKEVRDKDGKVGYRKMETRLIVVRADEKLPNGGFRPRALRAAYAWDRDERIARRVKDPFRNGEPAADRFCAYIVDESTPRDPALNPISDHISENCTYMNTEELSNPSSGKIRHYAIPSTERCDQCHMGSSSRSYILGFNPWQVDRRPDGEGGVYEAAMPDELSQLKRLIDYGVITGIEPGQAKLENSQGDRKPRNDYELKAQGYMMGNCVFCHNPNGFPVVQNPALRPFDMYPSATGGIFQFSLERYSPRAKAGKAQAIRYPYVTSTFGDHTVDPTGEEPEDTKVRNRALLAEIEGFDKPMGPVLDTHQSPPDYDAEQGVFQFLGPWRSLLWRNVYTPFTYNEDGAIFVHMPRNAPGYDCRAHNIMADWMLGIPSVLKAQVADRREQPMVEVTEAEAGPEGFAQAVAAAKKRIEDYHRGVTGAYCPENDDIVDPRVLSSPLDPETSRRQQLSPVDSGISGPRLTPNYPHKTELFDAVPDHAHWVPTDTTDLPGRWTPRRVNWEEVIASRTVPVSNTLEPVIDHLQEIHLSSELEEFALEPLPMGLWHEDCQGRPEAASSPTVGQLKANPSEPLHRWLAGRVLSNDERQKDDARVHHQSRGEAVFRAICQNCHGQQADSKSPLAATILEITGGQTRVANFVAGLFGPAAAPGAYARDEFLINRGATPDEWQARYVLFMGLGGTEADIPQSVLNLVAASPFYGMAVTAPEVSPNMLGAAQEMCFSVLRSKRLLPDDQAASVIDTTSSTTFAANRGHYELWESLCSHGNEPVVQVFRFRDGTRNPGGTYRAQDDRGGWVYPPDHPVGNHRGEIEIGIQSSNNLPWCLRVEDEEQVAEARVWAEDVGIAPDELPICPETLFAETLGKQAYLLPIGTSAEQALGNADFVERWQRQGAMNAGLSAFYYLRGLTSGEVQASLPFDFCLE
jgi:mono/diheme cytochrome c family protein